MHRLIQKPGATFSFIYPDFEKTRRRHVLEFVASIMSGTHELRQTTATGDQFFEHGLGCSGLLVVIEQPLMLCDVSDLSAALYRRSCEISPQ